MAPGRCPNTNKSIVHIALCLLISYTLLTQSSTLPLFDHSLVPRCFPSTTWLFFVAPYRTLLSPRQMQDQLPQLGTPSQKQVRFCSKPFIDLTETTMPEKPISIPCVSHGDEFEPSPLLIWHASTTIVNSTSISSTK